MNEPDYDTLQSYLDEALLRLPIAAGRKTQLREELLAHLLEICDQERACGADEQTAIKTALHRFGGACELTTEFDSCVSFLDRFFFWVMSAKEKTMWRLLAFVALGLVLVLVGLAFVMPAIEQLVFQGFVALSVVLLALGVVLSMGGIWSCVHGVRRYRMAKA